MTDLSKPLWLAHRFLPNLPVSPHSSKSDPPANDYLKCTFLGTPSPTVCGFGDGAQDKLLTNMPGKFIDTKVWKTLL